MAAAATKRSFSFSPPDAAAAATRRRGRALRRLPRAAATRRIITSTPQRAGAAVTRRRSSFNPLRARPRGRALRRVNRARRQRSRAGVLRRVPPRACTRGGDTPGAYTCTPMPASIRGARMPHSSRLSWWYYFEFEFQLAGCSVVCCFRVMAMFI